jgi:hypothetical protein
MNAVVRQLFSLHSIYHVVEVCKRHAWGLLNIHINLVTFSVLLLGL